jgi:hypothetical protein
MWCTKSAAERIYLVRVMIAMSIYVGAIAAVSWSFHHRHPQGAVVYLLAMLPALPIFAVIASLGIYLAEEKDEFVRTVLVQCSLWATAIVLSIATCVGLLQTYVPSFAQRAGVTDYWVFTVWFLAYAAVQPFVRRRYK